VPGEKPPHGSLMMAAFVPDLAAVRQWLSAGADPNEANDGHTVLMEALEEPEDFLMSLTTPSSSSLKPARMFTLLTGMDARRSISQFAQVREL
jgi:hypothetical protein